MTKVLVIVGPTASGKSTIALEIAKRHNGEIISADSMQVYKYMDIGTDKVPLSQRKEIPHHLIDITYIKEPFSVARYQRLARQAVNDILGRGKLPIIAGGTGLYVRALIDDLKFPGGKVENKVRKDLEDELKEKGIDHLFKILAEIDPEAITFIDKRNHRRVIRALEVYRLTGKPFSQYRTDWRNYKPVFDAIIVGLKLTRELLYKRINQRVEEMIEKGLIDETRNLLKMSFKEAVVSRQALGYKELFDYFDGRATLPESIETIKKRTRNYAKRQLTWFKKDPRIVWIDARDKNKIISEVEYLLQV